MLDKYFVPYDRGLKLKELGFDEECFGFYHSVYKQDLIKYPVMGCVKNNLTEGEILAPLFCQVFDWFRRNYKISFIIGFGNDGGYYRINNIFSKWYETYEEAELACLDKLIEICEKSSVS